VCVCECSKILKMTFNNSLSLNGLRFSVVVDYDSSIITYLQHKERIGGKGMLKVKHRRKHEGGRHSK
jgi:hypothetical protein